MTDHARSLFLIKRQLRSFTFGLAIAIVTCHLCDVCAPCATGPHASYMFSCYLNGQGFRAAMSMKAGGRFPKRCEAVSVAAYIPSEERNIRPQVIARRIRQVLPDPLVALRCRDRSVSEAESELFESRASLMHQFRERAPGVMRRQIRYADPRTI